MTLKGFILQDDRGAIYAIPGDELARYEIDGESKTAAEDYLESAEVQGFDYKPGSTVNLVDVDLQMIFGNPIRYKAGS